MIGLSHHFLHLPMAREVPGLIGSVEEETGHAQLPSSLSLLSLGICLLPKSLCSGWFNDIHAEVFGGRKQ